jgi:putative transposase
LWEGRFKSCVVDSDAYLLRCKRYVELNPVRAAMVDAPEHYAWSSYRANALGAADDILRPHELYLRLNADPAKRQAAYRAFVADAISEDELSEIRAYVCQERALGRARFQAVIAEQAGRVAAYRPPGRQPKTMRKGL